MFRPAPLFIACLALLVSVPGALAQQKTDRPKAPNVMQLQVAAAKLAPLMTPKRAPGANDWLAGHREFPQPFHGYISSNPNRPNRTQTKLYLRQIGEFTPDEQRLVDAAEEYLSICFGLPVEKMRPIALESFPNAARRKNPHTGKLQLLTSYLLNGRLLQDRPNDAVAVLALSKADLWPGGDWNYVFGQATLTERVGVWSIARFGDPMFGGPKVLRRTVQLAAHETGHMFGIQHCIAHECGMNGINHLVESDRNQLIFCKDCELKLWWACNLDPIPRQREIVRFLERHELEWDAAEARKRLEALEKR